MVYRIELVKEENILLERNFSGDAPIIEKNKFFDICDVYGNMVQSSKITYSLYYLDNKGLKKVRRKKFLRHQSKRLICQFYLDPNNLEFYMTNICIHYMLKTEMIK